MTTYQNLKYSSNRFIWKALDWLYPPLCPGCGKAAVRMCPDCMARITLITRPQCPVCGDILKFGKSTCGVCADKTQFFSALASWAEYAGPLRSAIHSLKYKNNIGLGDFFAGYLIELLRSKSFPVNLIVPVPLSKSRIRTRGFNQSLLLARPVSFYLQIPLSNTALRRIKETDSQVHLNAHEREQNMAGAFSGNPATLKGRSVLLVDDIITTGATINHCSEALLRAGAVRVYAVALAKTFREKVVPEYN